MLNFRMLKFEVSPTYIRFPLSNSLYMKSIALSLCALALLSMSSNAQESIQSFNARSRLALSQKIANHVQTQLNNVFLKNQVFPQTMGPDYSSLSYPGSYPGTNAATTTVITQVTSPTQQSKVSVTSTPTIITYSTMPTLPPMAPPPPINMNYPPQNTNYIHGLDNLVSGQQNMLSGNGNLIQGSVNSVSANKAIVQGSLNRVMDMPIDERELY